MARYETANTIINDAALEVGLVPATDPYASQDEAFIQLRGLLTSAGRELCDMHNWSLLIENYSVTTAEGDTGDYPLPGDFNRMINQTGWDQNRHRIWKVEIYPQPPFMRHFGWKMGYFAFFLNLHPFLLVVRLQVFKAFMLRLST